MASTTELKDRPVEELVAIIGGLRATVAKQAARLEATGKGRDDLRTGGRADARDGRGERQGGRR